MVYSTDDVIKKDFFLYFLFVVGSYSHVTNSTCSILVYSYIFLLYYDNVFYHSA
jgi:hypothetical protein